MSRLNTFVTGLRVLDLSRHLPGPMASLMLADMGADVLKIEAPSGDEFEQLGPRGPNGEGIFYETVNAGKSVVKLDLKERGDWAFFLDLIAEADVLIEGFRPDVMARLGLAYETLKAYNPRLIYCSVNGFGAGGPMAQAAGHDNNYLALAGALHRNGTDIPVYFDPPVADMTGSLFAIIAILGALHERARTGQGCAIDLGLADAIMPLQLVQLAAAAVSGASPGRGETYLNGGAAYYRVYATGDGRHVALGSLEHRFWRRFCEAAGRPDWIARHDDPLPHRALMAEVEAYFSRLSLKDCLTRFGEADCCLSPVLDLNEAIETPHFRERGLVRPGPDGSVQSLFPAVLNGERPSLREPVRRIGKAEAAERFAGRKA